MKIREIMENASGGSTGSGAIATVAAPIGGMITRNGGNFFSGKYITGADPTPNTPKEYKKKQGKKNAK
jgi:hypothetical protein